MKPNSIKGGLSFLTGSRLFKSSFWGIAANGMQSVLLSLFFVIMARKYSEPQFATFLIATTIYQFLAAFSTLGLGQWFTREVVHTIDKNELVNKFLKMQIYSGVLFYAVNIVIAYTLYSDAAIQNLTLILGINIVFDNMIYAIRSLNVAEFKQQKTFVILLADSVLKFLAACILLIYPLPVLTLSVILILIRFITLNVFLSFGSSNSINLRKLLAYKISFAEVKKIVAPNWAFIIIGSVSMVYWRIGNLIISKLLTLNDVANYEVSYRIFSLALILPLIVSTTVFPSLVELHKSGNQQKFNTYFHKVFLMYLLYSLLTYTFFYSFSDYIIPFAFGEKYLENAYYTKQMFLTVLIFPTALLQANVLVAIHQEKSDMWLNIISLVANVAFCFIGLYFYKSLTVINFSIFASFLIFHICQDVLLIKNKIASINKVIKFYFITIVCAGGYVLLSQYVNPLVLFSLFWFMLIVLVFVFGIKISGIKNMIKNAAPITEKDIANQEKSIM
jgi:O-antigen/teichoic acid export membrane protein